MEILSRSLLNVGLGGRVTFVAAGAVLGVGIYGFAVTLKPYESGRVLEPFTVSMVGPVVSSGPVIQPPSWVFPEGTVAPGAAVAPGAPGEALVAVAPAAPVVASAPAPEPPVAAAGTGDGAAPLPPPEEEESAPRGIGPQEIAPENVLVVIYGSWPDPQADNGTDEPPGQAPNEPREPKDTGETRHSNEASSSKDNHDARKGKGKGGRS